MLIRLLFSTPPRLVVIAIILADVAFIISDAQRGRFGIRNWLYLIHDASYLPSSDLPSLFVTRTSISN